uniref:Uncharacterized protein n=1 Tax=Catagonus wagneri TaxID=51154 RepID=A0A8C3YMC7_9CETA
MAGAWRALVLVAGLAAVASVAQCSLSYEEIVTQVLQFFNQGRPGQRLFCLLETIPPPRLNFTTNIPLNFRIKETVCFSTGLRCPRWPRRKCAFREGGAGGYSSDSTPSLGPSICRCCGPKRQKKKIMFFLLLFFFLL